MWYHIALEWFTPCVEHLFAYCYTTTQLLSFHKYCTNPFISVELANIRLVLLPVLQVYAVYRFQSLCLNNSTEWIPTAKLFTRLVRIKMSTKGSPTQMRDSYFYVANLLACHLCITPFLSFFGYFWQVESYFLIYSTFVGLMPKLFFYSELSFSSDFVSTHFKCDIRSAQFCRWLVDAICNQLYIMRLVIY